MKKAIITDNEGCKLETTIPQDQPKPFHCADRLELDENEKCTEQCVFCKPKQTEALGYEKKYTAKDMTEYAMYILNNPVITPFEWYKNNTKTKHNGK